MKGSWHYLDLKMGGPLDRLVIFLGNLSLGSLVTHYLLSYKSIRSLEASLDELFSSVSNLLGLPSEFLAYLPMIFLVTQALVFFMNLFFGRTLFDFIVGFRNSGPWWWQRIGGASRALLDIFLGPFILFDFPILWDKATYKEKISGSFYIRTKNQNPLRVLLILPFIIFFSLFAPLLTNLELMSGHPLTEVKIEAKGLNESGNFSQYKEVASELFHFKSFTSLGVGEFELIPDYERIRARSKKRISPTLLIYDHKNHTSGHWRVKKQISLLTLLGLGRRGNPFFSSHFPRLDALIEMKRAHPESFDKIDAMSKERRDDLFNEEVKKEIKAFFKASFELGGDQWIGHILTYGPFMRGFIEVRQAVLGMLPQGAKAEVDWVEMGNHSFLRFRQNHGENSILGKSITESYLAVGTENSLLFEMGWSGNFSGALSSKRFRESVLGRGEWFFDYYHLFSNRLNQMLNDSTKVLALTILDQFVAQELKEKDKDILQQALYRFYFDLAREAIKNSDLQFYDLLKDNFERITDFIEYKNALAEKKKKSYFSSLFSKEWKSLWNALRLKDNKYFTDKKRNLKF